jgi:magnesium-transporting ATPase (P-type)
MYMKGASEVILSRCGTVFGKTEGGYGVKRMGKDDLAAANNAITDYANKGYRTIAASYRDLKTEELGQINRYVVFVSPGSTKAETEAMGISFAADYSGVPAFQGQPVAVKEVFDGQPLDGYDTPAFHQGTKQGIPEPILESDCTFLGIIAIQDPLRDGVKKAIQQCNTAGVDVRMVTGDNLRTAVSIASNAGILGEHHWNHLFDSNEVTIRSKRFKMIDMSGSEPTPWKGFNRAGTEWGFVTEADGDFRFSEKFSIYKQHVAEHMPMLDVEKLMKADKRMTKRDIEDFKKGCKECRGVVVAPEGYNFVPGDEANEAPEFSTKIDDCSTMAELYNKLVVRMGFGKEVDGEIVVSEDVVFVSQDPLVYIRQNVAMEGTYFENKVIYTPPAAEGEKQQISQFGKGSATDINWYCREQECIDFVIDEVAFQARNHPQREYSDGKDGKMTKPAFNLEVMDTVWPRLRVMARCQPEHKECLVTGMMESMLHMREDKVAELIKKDNIHIAPEGQIVAVTGDGTNDAPSLKKAHVGFAMGIAGTKVSKNACDIVLLDDNFKSTVTAIKWGRNVYDSVVKFLQFQLTVNIVAIIVASIGACLYQSSPLGAIQMLWVNLIMDSLGSLALATEKPSETLLLRHPYGKTQNLISTPMWFNMLGQSVYQLIVVLLTMFVGEYIFYDESNTADRAQIKNVFNGTTTYTDADYLKIGRVAGCEYTEHYTCLFNVFVMMTLFNQVAARKLNNEYNILEGILNNKYFLIIVGIEAILQVGFVQLLGKAVGCKALTAMQWGMCIVFAFGCWIWQMPLNALANFAKPLLKEREEKKRKEQLRNGVQEGVLDTLTEILPVPLSKRVNTSSNLSRNNWSKRPDGK